MSEVICIHVYNVYILLNVKLQISFVTLFSCHSCVDHPYVHIKNWFIMISVHISSYRCPREFKVWRARVQKRKELLKA